MVLAERPNSSAISFDWRPSRTRRRQAASIGVRRWAAFTDVVVSDTLADNRLNHRR
jgi:hypothetical protein